MTTRSSTSRPTPRRSRTPRSPRRSACASTARPRRPAPSAEDAGGDRVQVTLDPQDGDAGSGAVLTQYRVDGGPWLTYSAAEDEQLFDGSSGSLGEWEQAGGGHFELLDDGSGGITPVDGLGMLWYPVKQFGDFKLKFQFREGRTDGGHSNGGAFTRFPDPRVPVEQRTDECAKTGAAAEDPGMGGDLLRPRDPALRRTGGRAAEDRVDLQLRPERPRRDRGADRGRWNDYEIEVVGQTYTISRNGEVINEFENTPGQESSRDGDPPTDLRQFAEGYVGFQNHGGADTMQYRDIRVEDLSDDAPAQQRDRAVQVAGAGPHTVEFRSVDAAGNVEDEAGARHRDRADGAARRAGPSGNPPAGELPPMIDSPATFSLARISRADRRQRFAKRGLRVPVQCTGAMSGTVKLTVARATARKLKLGSRTIKARDVRCYGAHTATVTLKPSKRVARKLRRGKGSVRLRLAVQMLDFGKPAQTATKTITLRR